MNIGEDQVYYDKSGILKMLKDNDLRQIIKLFNDKQSAKYVLSILDKTFNEYSSYKPGDPLSKNDSGCNTLEDAILQLPISNKDSHREPSEAYKEIYMNIFVDEKIKKHGNVSKLRKLINEIFGIILKDKDIKKDEDDWWYE